MVARALPSRDVMIEDEDASTIQCSLRSKDLGRHPIREGKVRLVVKVLARWRLGPEQRKAVDALLAIRHASQTSTRPHAFPQTIEQVDGLLPPDTRIGHRLTVLEPMRSIDRYRLFTSDEVALDHDAENTMRRLRRRKLFRYILRNDDLSFVVLLTVAVTAIDHDALR